MTSFDWSKGLVAAACCLGLAGILIGAAGSHAGGGDLARLASVFLLVHAAAAVGLTAWSSHIGTGQRLGLLAVTVMEVGVALFSGDLAVVAFSGTHLPVPLAPIGGMLLVVAWIGGIVVALRARPRG